MKFIPQGLTQKIGREILTMKKNSPKILFVAGIAGVITSTVLACRSTTKLPAVLDDFKSDIENVKGLDGAKHGGYDQKQYHKDMVYVYIKGTSKLVQLYAPALVLGGASIAALTSSHVTLTRRNAGLSAAYSAVQASYNAYRDRVREQLGEEKELDIYHAATTEKVEIDGKIKQLKKVDPNKWSPYARIFDETNRNWARNAEQNRIFIQAQQNYANHRLHARGHIFLNEIYDDLGFPHTTAGAVVGWILNEGGDNFIDFGLFKAASSQFINGWEQSIILDFNVDGEIYKLI